MLASKLDPIVFWLNLFELPQRDNTIRRYRDHWRRFLCYIFRMQRLTSRLTERLSDICGLHLTGTQIVMMDCLWYELFRDSVASGTQGTVCDNLEPLHEKLFQLFRMFWMDLCHDGIMEQNAHCSLLWRARIHRLELAFPLCL